MPSAPSQRYLAEFVGTFGLLLFGGGTAVTTLGWGEPLARVGLVSMAFGFTVTALAYGLGDISGGHFNPAVTVSMAASRRMPISEVLPYIVAQLLGGIVGIGVVAAIIDGASDPFQAAQSAALGSQCFSWSAVNSPPGCGFSALSVLVLEVALTFVFVLVIQLVTRPESSAKNLAPVAIGIALLVTNLTAIPIDGASINPVRSFAPALLSAAWQPAQWAIKESWMFWIAPIIGGLLASFAERMLRPSGAAP